MIALTVLGSGSQGNCSVLEFGSPDRSRLLFVDAGLSPRQTRLRLAAALRRQPEEATDLFLTHLDGDHFREGWGRLLRRHPIRVHLHPAHVGEAIARGVPEESIEPIAEATELGDGLTVHVCRTPHDVRGTAAFLFERSEGASVARLGYATDLGRVPEPLFGHFEDLDLLAIESNYDCCLQEESLRPRILKDRIMGGRGHLSNEQSLAAALRMSRSGDLQAIVLLHLSRQCNCPTLVERLWREQAPQLADRLVVSGQFHPTPTVRVAPRPRRRRTESASLFDPAS